MHIFIKVGARLRGQRLSYLSMCLLYIVFLSFSPKFSRSLYAPSVAFYAPLNAMCFTNPICFFYFLVSLSLTASFQNLLKTCIKLHKIAYKMSTNCLWGGGGVVEKGEGGDTRIGGRRAPWLLGDRHLCIYQTERHDVWFWCGSFRLNLDLFATGLRTRTGLACLPRVS